MKITISIIIIHILVTLIAQECTPNKHITDFWSSKYSFIEVLPVFPFQKYKTILSHSHTTVLISHSLRATIKILICSMLLQ